MARSIFKSKQARLFRRWFLEGARDVGAHRIGGVHPGIRAMFAATAIFLEVEVEITERVMPGVVSLPHGWGHDLPGTRLHVAAERPGANLNALLDDQQRDPLSGNAVLAALARWSDAGTLKPFCRVPAASSATKARR